MTTAAKDGLFLFLPLNYCANRGKLMHQPLISGGCFPPIWSGSCRTRSHELSLNQWVTGDFVGGYGLVIV